MKIVSDRKVPFTRKLATLLLDIHEVEWERPLRDNHVAFLHKQMEGGHFQAEHVTLATCALGRNEYRINGHHTCWARIDMPNDWQPIVRYVKYSAKSEREMRDLYSRIDRGASRTNKHIVACRTLGMPEFDGYSRQNIQKASEGFNFWMWEKGSDRRQYTPDDKADLMLGKFNAICKTVIEVLGTRGRDTGHVWRAPVIGAMFETISKAAKDSHEFWSAVRQGIGFESANDPRLKLRNYLTNTSVRPDGRAKKSVTQEEMYRACIYAWNAYRDRTPMKLLRVSIGVGSGRPKAK